MRLFGRRAPSGPDGFWSWWATEGRAATTAALEQDDSPGPLDTLGEAVSALHPELAWQVGPGETSTYSLCVTAAGHPELRAVARRWLITAPGGDETWSWSDHRPPAADPESVTLASGIGSDVDFARVTVTARVAGSRFDVVVHHPAFADLAEDARARLAFLALDAALGEQDVELWIGQVTASEMSLVDGFGLAGLRSVVADLRARHVDADGQPSWSVLTAETPQGPLVAMAMTPLHPVVAPLLTQHAVARLPYATRNDSGLPVETSLAALRSFEESLGAALGATGRVVAHESSAGARVLHVYLDETTDALAVVRRHAGAWAEGPAQVESAPDPSWQGVDYLRG